MRQQQLARFGGCGAAPVAQQQALAQFDFEQPHLATQGRLGYIQRDGGTGKAAKFGDAYKIFKLFEIHGMILLPYLIRRYAGLL